MRYICLLVLIFNFSLLWASDDPMGIFSGRVSKVNEPGALVRIKSTFPNLKYINKRDKLSFWDDINPLIRCNGYVLGKSNEYLLVRVPDYKTCIVAVHLGEGKYLKFFSQDLANNLIMGKELVSILMKKRLALNGKLIRTQRELDNYMEKVAAVNDRFKVLREKLEAEWREELSVIEDDRLVTYRNFNDTTMRLEEIDHKLEKYKVSDENLVYDRWALDPRLHYKK